LTDQDEKLFERQYFRREFFSFPSMLRSTENRLSGMNFRGGMLLGASLHPTLRAIALILSRRINLADILFAGDKD
jgi:hypothetical protein